MAMEGTGLREQLRRAAHEYLLSSPYGNEPCAEFHVGSCFRTYTGVWGQAAHSAT